MNESTKTRISGLLGSKKRHALYLRILAVLAVVVAINVALVLRQTGVAMTHLEVRLDCHVAGEVAHTHNADCYDDDGVLVCTLEERPVHEHTDACYDDETGALTCGLDELISEHVHGPGCFVTVTVPDDRPDDTSVPGNASVQATGAANMSDGTPQTGGNATTTTNSTSTSANGTSASTSQGNPRQTVEAVEASADTAVATVGSESAEVVAEVAKQPMPAQSFVHVFRDQEKNALLTVAVDAPEGALPAGSAMQVSWVAAGDLTARQQQAVERAVARRAEGAIVGQQAVDISFRDAAGSEVEPAEKITVTLTSALVGTQDKPLVVHVDDLTAAQVAQQEKAIARGKTAEQAEPARTAQVVDALDEVELENREIVLESDQLAFEGDTFSTYVLVVTTLQKQMVASDGNTYTVTVDAPAEAGVPQDAELQVSEYQRPDSTWEDCNTQLTEALGVEPGYARLFNISIMSGQTELQPVNPVSVRIELADADKLSDNLHVVHFAADGTLEEVAATRDGATVSFEATGFSVYAVVDEGDVEDESRATVNFYGADTSEPLATVYVKNSDTPEELESIVFDPGCGTLDGSRHELFDGWVVSNTNTTDGSSYTIDTEGKTIAEIRSILADMDIQEGDVVNIYAKIVRTITISYVGEDGETILGSTTLKVLGSDSPSSSDNIAEYTISMNYTPETSTQAFMGWNVAEGASNILSAQYEGESASEPYVNGTSLQVQGDVTLSVNAPYGHWLVFDENGKGATYNAPSFIKDGETTSEPTLDMTRLGYSFGGWYTDPDCTAGNEFSFGGELTDNTTVYAKWTPTATANYTVIVWKERMSDTYAENGGTGEGKVKNYDFSESYTFTGNVGTIASSVSNATSSVVDGDAAGTRYYNARVRGVSSSGGNIDETISYTGYHCAEYDTGVTITPEGNTVINVYYDRNTVTYTFYTYGQSSTSGTWWLCKENGDQIIQSGKSANNNTRIATRNGENYTQYTGPVASDDGRTYYYSTTSACGGTNMREAHWEYVTSSGSSWNVYQESTGLYGEKLAWPTDTGIWWYEGHNNTSGTGTRMTYKDAFLPLDDDMTVEYWGNRASASGTIHFWTQDVDGGSSYTDQVQVATGNANFNINDKFTGFRAYQYRKDNGSWQNVGDLNEATGIYGGPVSYNSRLDIRYNRIKERIAFLDGSYFDGNGNRIDETPQAEEFYTSPEYYYEADVSSYNKSGEDYYTPPEKAGYTFAGWYADDACTVPYEFSTMPATGITVYAKWVQNQYRVFLHPNVPESDTTLSWGSENQDMTFRVSSGSNVSVPTGTRSGYKMVGWYLDEACTQVFDGDRYVLNDTSVTTLYDKTVDMTDVMNKYGNIVGEGSNSDLTGNNGAERFWITRKLDLYAKWRAELIGADGIGVKYDAGSGSNAPQDTNLYLDNTDTVAQGAPTPPDDSQQFLYWVIQTWDEEAGKYVDIEGENGKVYPGESFTVLKENAYIEELEGSTPDNPKYRYTVQLRAQYGPKDEPTPTHLTWYANGGSATDGTVSYTDSDLQVNEAVVIRPSDTFTRPGYEFIGWARIDATTEGYELSERELTEDDLFLKYEDGSFYAQITDGSDEWSEVQKVAADERTPYHDLYAVWKKKTYTVEVTKEVFGLSEDQDIPFAFTPMFDGLTAEAYTAPFKIVGNTAGADVVEGGFTVHYEHTKTFVEVPYGTTFNVTEATNEQFQVSCEYTVSNADIESDNTTVYGVENGANIIVKGDVSLKVTNARGTQKVRIVKTALDETTPLGGAVFSVTVDGADHVLTSDETEGYLKNDDYPDGIISIPFGSYNLRETEAPDGYTQLETPVQISVDETGIHLAGYTVKEPTGEEDYFTVIIPNNPGVELPAAGGFGVQGLYVMGAVLIMLGGLPLIIKRLSAYKE